MPLRLFATLVVVSALGLLSCRARWRPVGSEVDQGVATKSSVAHLEAGPSGEAAHAHRQLSFDFEQVWNATVEAIHTTGVAVPKSARRTDGEGLIDVDALWVRLTRIEPESTCVLVHYRGLADEAGVERAGELLDEVERRLQRRP